MWNLRPTLGTRTALLGLTAIAVLLQIGSAQATPARAQALGGYDLHHPNSINTFIYFDDDVNIFVNPALIYKYRNRVDLSLGLEGGSTSGIGASPFGGFLIDPADSGFVLGLFLNRDPMLFGNQSALGPVVGELINGGMGGSFNTGSQGGAGMNSAEYRFPLDAFVGGAIGDTSIGGNIYIAGGSQRAHDETYVDAGDDDYWIIEDQAAKSLYVAGRFGFHHEGKVASPGAYLGFSKLDAWADAFSYDTDQGDDEPYVSHTEGLRGAMQLLGGVRVGIDADPVTIIPHLGVTYGMGQTFVDENLGDETTVENLANNEFKASALDLNVGAGFTYKPKKDLKIIWTASAQVRRLQVTTNDHMGTLDDDVPDGAKTSETWSAGTAFAGPVVSVAAEYRPFKHLQLRGGLRANVLFGRYSVRDIDYLDREVQYDGRLNYDQSDEPSLSAAFGLSVPMGVMSLDATFGGLVMGGADMQFFSRLDMRAMW